MNVIQTGGQPFSYGGKVALGGDGPGHVMKGAVCDYLRECGVHFTDAGNRDSCLEAVSDTAGLIAGGGCQAGVVFVTEAEAACALANRLPGIRCACGDNPSRVMLGRQENDVILCLIDVGRVGFGVAMESVWKLLTTGFSGGEFSRIIDELDKEEANHEGSHCQ